MVKVIVNGRFYSQKVTGVQRYAREIISELDKIYDENLIDLKVLVPEDCSDVPELSRISVIKYKRDRTFIWDQICYKSFCKKNKAFGLCLSTIAPFCYFRNSINVIHDAATLAHPEYYSKKFILFNKFMWNRIDKLKKIVTVSEFSQSEISRYCHVDRDKIAVIPNAWDHMKRVDFNNMIFKQYPMLERKKYCFSMSSLSPNKNFKWIVEVAKRNPGYYFAIAGMKIGLFSDELLGDIPKNVIFLGYVTDEEAKALMRDCAYYLFPTLYEGFGITPLEALSVGCNAIVSDTDVMHEVYGESVRYVDPCRYDYFLEDFKIRDNKNEVERVLEKYTWRQSAQKLYQLLLEL